MKKISKNVIRLLMKPREEDSNKGTYGHALLVVGNKGRMGAAVIAARACLRAGCGLLTLNIPKEERFILQTTIPEAMLVMRQEDEHQLNSYSALGIGPGIGIDKKTEQMLIRFLTEFKKPLLLDADALNIIAANKKLFSKVPKGTILTPHPKEFDRLFGIHKTSEDRIQTAIKKAKEHDVVIVLKGHKTLVMFADNCFINTTGNAGLAKGGSGDALTGIITSFLAQGYEPFNAAKQGVYLHGLAADIALKEQSMESVLIT
jgi:hydroxyethylthiazole kinase-like uncharacterized protein yjeF